MAGTSYLTTLRWPAEMVSARSHQQHRHRSHLAFEELTAGAPTPEHPTASPSRTLLVLHGLLGCGRNWRTWARRLVEGAAAAHPPQGGPWRALLVDLRCHGESSRRPGFHPPHTMRAAAEDVSQLIRDQMGSHAPGAILGHSMGGKVALALLGGAAEAAAASRQHHHHNHQPAPQQLQGLQGPQVHQHQHQHVLHQHHSPGQEQAVGVRWCSPPRQLWVLDSQPGRVAKELDAGIGVSRVLHEVQSVPLPIPSRAWLLAHLRGRGLSEALATWLASSTHPAYPGLLQPPPQHQQQEQQQPLQAAHHHHHHHQQHSHSQHGGQQQLTWTFDVQGAGAMYMSYRSTDFWHVLERPPPGTTVHLVQGARSDRWPSEMQQRLLAAVSASSEAGAREGTRAGLEAPGGDAAGGPMALGQGTFERHVLEAAGHWLHVDNPQGLLRLVLPRLAGL